jgi:arginine utilization protein RocB
MDFYNDIKKLTIDLVKTPSINNTEGEKVIAEKIAAYIRSINYFKKHPESVWEVPLKNDRYGRKNVFALLRGENKNSPITIILHGHIDTVGVEDYGELMPYAFDCVELEKKLKLKELPHEARQDLESGEYLFGRGSNDMKSGVASHLVVLKEMTKKVKEFSGNILFMANPVEENQHTGIIESLKILKKLKAKEGLEYKVAINNDVVSPLYQGDKKKYIYLGAVGKLLPCFYIVGKETHVGQCYEGLDPNFIAAELIKLINLNTDLCDSYEGEFTLPPVALKLTDLKPSYNVQTPIASFLYFNYFNYNQPIDNIIDILKKKAELAVKNVLLYMNEQYKKYCSKTGLSFSAISWKPRVITYNQLYQETKEKVGDQIDHRIRELATELLNKGEDTRDICLKIVKEVKILGKNQNPEVIIFFSPPYCPNNTLKEKIEEEKEIIMNVKDVSEEVSHQFDEKIEIRKFFPALSDSSYLKIDDNDASLNTLVNNFPEWDIVYPVPIKDIKDTNIPAINFGAYGKDPHCWTERVHKRYSFSILPKMTIRMIEKTLNM